MRAAPASSLRKLGFLFLSLWCFFRIRAQDFFAFPGQIRESFAFDGGRVKVGVITSALRGDITTVSCSLEIVIKNEDEDEDGKKERRLLSVVFRAWKETIKTSRIAH